MNSAVARLAEFVDTGKPRRVLAEVHGTVAGILGKDDLDRLDRVFTEIRSLFAGRYPGYSRCNTRYHDLEHTTDTLLAMARLVHGSFEAGRPIDRHTVLLGLVGTLLHDTGYIQTIKDHDGTGAKYTASHIMRSIGFAREYLASRGYSRADYAVCRNALLCTGIQNRITKIPFRTEDEAAIGKMLGTSDLLGQMASRRYLEKLPHLYSELVEGEVLSHVREYDFLKDTTAFYRATLDRFAGDLGGVSAYMRDHFRARWGIDRDLYREAIDENIAQLETILGSHPTGYLRLLKGKAGGPTPPRRAPRAASRAAGVP
ncbi:MAG: hypothetical protein ACM3NF_09040 [Gemmatimonadota bacterium]